MKTELIIATYNKPRHLAVVLASLAQQEMRCDSVCVADDGSGPETRAVIEAFFQASDGLRWRHEWHTDEGFSKNRILNRAIAGSDADYLIFIDDDCVMHPGFVARHCQLARPDRFMAGSVIRLTEATTGRLLERGSPVWTGAGVPDGWVARKWSERLKSRPMPVPVMGVLELLSPVKRNWAGGNASAFRSALVAVNGFDETLAYGGEDKELGARLTNSGVTGRHIRYTAPLYHLDHGRGYVDREAVASNRHRIEEVRREQITWTEDGIVKGLVLSAPERNT